MVVPKQYQSDIKVILDRRDDNGGDYWTSSDAKY